LDDLGLRALDELPALGANEMTEAMQSLTLEAAALAANSIAVSQASELDVELTVTTDPNTVELDFAQAPDQEQTEQEQTEQEQTDVETPASAELPQSTEEQSTHYPNLESK
jgi:hypothetical protein